MNQDLACFRFTGGTCSFFACKEEMGPTECVSKLCFCQPGYCASVRGVCERLRGRTLGEFSIRFADPAETQRPYLGVDKHHRPAAIEHAGIQWRVALTHDGFVRFESTQHVGQVLTLYQDRRRRTQAHTMLLGAQANRESGSPRAEGQPTPCAVAARTASGRVYANCSGGMSEDDDLWPRMRDIRFIPPPEASFLVRSTWGGLEIWHPQTGASLATAASTDWMRSDGELGRDTGLAECYPRVHTVFGWGAGCQSRNLVAFEPELPADAVCARCSAGQVSSSPWRFWKAAMPWLLMAALTP